MGGLPWACKMRTPSRYASDADCRACGAGEGDVCAEYEEQSEAMLAERRAQHEARLRDPKLTCPYAVGMP